MPYIEKRIVSGPMLEIERYAITDTGRRKPRSPKERPSTEEQQKLNDKNAKKTISRLANANFTLNDFFMSVDYAKKIPEAEAKKKLRNYFRKLNALRKKRGLPQLKYITTTVMKCGKPHHHIIMSGNGMTLDEVEGLWDGDDRINISKLKPDAFGLEGVAKYLAKQGQSKRRWNSSKNLKKPEITRKIIKRINIYKQPQPPKGYKIIHTETQDNLYTGPYQYIVMTKFFIEDRNGGG